MPKVRSTWGLGLYGGFDPDDKVTWGGTPFVIEEVTGQKRRLSLRGTALPVGAVELPLKRTTKSTSYGGQPRKSQQVLGVDYGSTTINGTWFSAELSADSLILWRSSETGADETVESAEDARELVYSLVKAGQELRVQWAGVERHSSAVDFRPNVRRRTEIDWSLMFEWAGEAKFVKLPVADPVVDGTSDFFDEIGEFLDLAKTPANLAADAADFADQQLRRIQGFINEARKILDAYRNGPASLRDIAGRAANIFDMIARTAKELRADIIGAHAYPLTTSAKWDQPSGAAIQKRIQKWLTDTRRYALRTQGRARSLRNQFEGFIQSPVRRAITAQGDTDLRLIAQQYMGGASAWITLRKFNGLTSSAVAAGTVILIPTRDHGA